MKKIFFITLLSYISFSCSDNHTREQSVAEPVAEAKLADVAELKEMPANAAQNTPENSEQINQQPTNEKKIIKTGEIQVVAKDIKASKEGIDRLLKQFSAYYENESISDSEYVTSYNLTIRIPKQHFDPFIQQLEQGTDKISHKSIRADDVSLQYHDLTSRINSKRAYLLRYQEMVKKAQTVKDLLEIEEQIRQLQEDIESQENVLRHLRDQVTYSTLTVTISQQQSATPFTNSFGQDLLDAIAGGWKLIKLGLVGLITIWPVLIIVIAGIFVWRRRKTKRSVK